MKQVNNKMKLGKSSVRVFVAEGSREVGERLVKLIIGLENATIVGETDRSRDLVRAVRQLNPDVVVLDLNLQERAILLIPLLKAQQPNLGIIVLSDYPDDLTKGICMRYGADLFLDKSRDIDRLLCTLASWNNHASSGVAS